MALNVCFYGLDTTSESSDSKVDITDIHVFLAEYEGFETLISQFSLFELAQKTSSISNRVYERTVCFK